MQVFSLYVKKAFERIIFETFIYISKTKTVMIIGNMPENIFAPDNVQQR